MIILVLIKMNSLIKICVQLIIKCPLLIYYYQDLASYDVGSPLVLLRVLESSSHEVCSY